MKEGETQSASTEGEAIIAARVALTGAAKQVQAQAAEEAKFHQLQVVTICWDADGAFRVNYPSAVNINVLMGLLARAQAACAEPSRYDTAGKLLKGVG